MPGIDGFTFVALTREDPVLRETPAILVSSRSSAEDRPRGAEGGASGITASATVGSQGGAGQVALSAGGALSLSGGAQVSSATAGSANFRSATLRRRDVRLTSRRYPACASSSAASGSRMVTVVPA